MLAQKLRDRDRIQTFSIFTICSFCLFIQKLMISINFSWQKYLYVHQWILLFIFKSINFHDNVYKIIPTYLRGISPCTSFKAIPNFYNSQETNIHFICRIQFGLIPLNYKDTEHFFPLDKIRRRKIVYHLLS